MTATTESMPTLQNQDTIMPPAKRFSSNSMSPAIMDSLPGEVLQQVANTYLNPLERSRLSVCSRRLHQLLPRLLQIKIVASCTSAPDKADEEKSCSLSHGFFVSPAFEDNEIVDDKLAANFGMSLVSQSLKASDNLRYGQRYYLWTFDYKRSNVVFLGRHTRHAFRDTEATNNRQHRYSMGLRPRVPNQTWEVTSSSQSMKDSQGDVVMWGEDVSLSVGGTNPDSRQPDSNQRSYLSCRRAVPDSTRDAINNPRDPNTEQSACWCAVRDECGPSEKLQLVPMDQHVTSQKTEEKRLPIHAIPEACEKGDYLLYSPKSLRDGSPTSDGKHVAVYFDFWVSKGFMHFHAENLPFSFSMPLLEDDFPSTCEETLNPVANLLHINSARWGSLLYYIANAADVMEGSTPNFKSFLQGVTNHPEHKVKVDHDRKHCYIDIPDQKLKQDLDVPVQFDNTEPPALPPWWCFVLSW